MLEILYQDKYLLAIYKPAALLVHRSNIDKYESRFAMQMLRDQIGQHVFPVHRLDKPTAGVLLFALNPITAAKMSGLFAVRAIEKEYIAVVRGYSDEHGLINYALREDLDKRSDQQARQNKQPQDAVTEYNRLAIAELPYPWTAIKVAVIHCYRLNQKQVGNIRLVVT